MSKQCAHCPEALFFLTFYVKHLPSQQLSKGKERKKGVGEASLRAGRGDSSLITDFPAPEKVETGLLAWPATTFLTLHRQETKSLRPQAGQGGKLLR